MEHKPHLALQPLVLCLEMLRLQLAEEHHMHLRRVHVNQGCNSASQLASDSQSTSNVTSIQVGGGVKRKLWGVRKL